MDHQNRTPELHDETRGFSRRRQRLVVVVFFAVLLPAGIAILRLAQPSDSTFYPRCALNAVTGLNCPGCGSTRALHALFTGNVAQAFAYNAVLIMALPLLMVVALQLSYSAWTGRAFTRRRLSGRAILAIVWLLLAYGIVRNIDVYPLTLLAPHELPLE